MSKVVLGILSLSIAALLFDAVVLEASTVSSATVEVPFAVHLRNQHQVFPAGEYRIERTVGSPLTWLINSKTGESVIFLNRAGYEPGHNTPQFASGADGMSQKAID